MKQVINNSLVALGLAFIAATLTLGIVKAFPSGWRVPFYNDGRAMISNGPGEGLHTGVSAQAIDFIPMDTWLSTGDVRAAHSGTIKVASFYSCPGNVLAIEQSAGGNASFYYHLSAFYVAVNQSVSRGTIVADFGNTGSCSEGAHLHFEGRSGVNWGNWPGSGTPIVVKDLRGIGWYPWWPHPDRYSGFVVQSTSHNLSNCSYDTTIDVRWPPAAQVVGGGAIDGYSWSWTTSSTTWFFARSCQHGIYDKRDLYQALDLSKYW
jgi:murein DD-endopeptidase MepM/ murein hydrolase activator NlpD